VKKAVRSVKMWAVRSAWKIAEPWAARRAATTVRSTAERSGLRLAAQMAGYWEKKMVESWA
jgi:hypothetical protein